VTRRPSLLGLIGAAALAATWGCAPDETPAPPAPLESQADAGPFAIDPQRILDDVEILTSDQMDGRTAGTPGGERAMAYVEATFRGLGLRAGGTVGYRQFFPLEGWHLTSRPRLALDGEALAYPAEFGVGGGSPATFVEGELVVVGHAVTVSPFDPATHPDCRFDPAGYDDFAGIDLRGKVAVAFAGLHPDGGFYGAPGCPDVAYGSANAAAHGAAAYVEVPAAARPQWFPEPPASYYGAASLPTVTLSRATIERVLPGALDLEAEVDATLIPHPRAGGVTASLAVPSARGNAGPANVIALAPGTSPQLREETVVIGAHLDAVGLGFPGADDNASGVAVMLELARAVAHARPGPARTVLFAAFAAEELGLLGSFAYCESPRRPLEQTVLMLSVDMVGAGDGTGLHLHPYPDADPSGPALDWALAALQDGAAAAGLPASVTEDTPMGRSDHVCFARAGVPAMLVNTPGTHRGYHSLNDRAENLSLADLGTAARLLWAGLEPIARGEVEVPARTGP
jgi:hypothetical protein